MNDPSPYFEFQQVVIKVKPDRHLANVFDDLMPLMDGPIKEIGVNKVFIVSEKYIVTVDRKPENKG